MSATMRIKKGDMVQIIAGKDKGKSGKIIAINHKKGVVYVEGLNMITKHTKPFGIISRRYHPYRRSYRCFKRYVPLRW